MVYDCEYGTLMNIRSENVTTQVIIIYVTVMRHEIWIVMVSKNGYFTCRIHPAAQSAISE